MAQELSDSSDTRNLLGGCQAGDQHSFELLFAKHRQELRRFIAHRLSPSVEKRLDASDVVQDVQATLFARLDAFLSNPRMPFRTWAIKTALDCVSHAHRRHIRTAKRQVTKEIPLSNASSIYVAEKLLRTPSESLSRREMIAAVRATLMELNDADREVLIMRYVDELSNQEIANILEISADAVSKRHGRALIRLAHRLGDLGF
jgi:RNA polymerase sigma-70 factor (ECF subfamily)